MNQAADGNSETKVDRGDVLFNGGRISVSLPCSLESFVATQVRDTRGVAVAVDGELVTKSQWGHFPLYHGASIEMVTIAQGG